MSDSLSGNEDDIQYLVVCYDLIIVSYCRVLSCDCLPRRVLGVMAGPGLRMTTTAWCSQPWGQQSLLHAVLGKRSLRILYKYSYSLNDWFLNIPKLTPANSGPPDCLCSESEECFVAEDNEVDIVPGVTEVRYDKIDDWWGFSWKFYPRRKSVRRSACSVLSVITTPGICRYSYYYKCLKTNI